MKVDPVALALNPAIIMKAQGFDVDPWQQDLLMSSERQVCLNCSRQSGKTETVAALALHTALTKPRQPVLLLSRSQRQSVELFRRILNGYNAIERPVKAVNETKLSLELANGARVICLPGREETVRGYSNASLLVLDEASRIPDDLYNSVRPMLVVSEGRIVMLSTPFGQRGFFWRTWQYGGEGDWKKVKITWKQCPRVSPHFIESEIREMGESWINQEYNCEFTAMEGLVYPNIEESIVDMWTPPEFGKGIGGIDFGWRNPFAAVWGVLDRDDILWIQNERYLRGVPLSDHAKALPKSVMWHADPSGATEIQELKITGLKVRKGHNKIRPGIAAVTARLETGRLKILSTGCKNLIEEAKLYRYPDKLESYYPGENPIDADNHALDALRYLVTGLDSRWMARQRKKIEDRPKEEPKKETPNPRLEILGVRASNKYDKWNDDRLWTSIN